MNYQSALDKLSGRESRKVGNNTYLHKAGEDIALRFHKTDVVTFKQNGDVVLDSGGWKTPSTKVRINDYIPGRIHQELSIWYVTYRDKTVPYSDKMILHANSTMTGEGEDPHKQIKLKKRIAQYSKAYIAQFLDGKVPKPGLGDCFYCGMRTVNEHIPLGEATKNTEHLESHLEEKYYVPGLLTRAIEVFPVSQAARGAIGEIWFPEQVPKPYWSKQSFLIGQIEKSLKRYMYRQFGFAS